MGNAVKKCANVTLSFFSKVGHIVSDGIKKTSEIVVNGVKKVFSFFKKVIEYCWNGIKIVGKLFYCAGKQLIHTLTGKSGIPYLVEFYNELINKNVNVKDENNNNINPNNYFNDIQSKMEEGDQVKVKMEIVKKKGNQTEDDMFKDFAENDDEEDILGLDIKESTAKIGNNDVSFDNISNADTCSEYN